MHPALLHSESLTLPSYGIAYLAAFLLATWAGYRLAPRVGIPGERFVDAAFLMMMVGEATARTAFLLVEWPRVVAGEIGWRNLLVGGRVVLPGVFAGFVFTCWYVRRHGIRPRNIADLAFTVTALGMALGRLGCFLGGCCYGRAAETGPAVVFRDPLAARWNGTPLDLPLVPVQLYQAAAALLLFAVLWRLLHRRAYEGQVAGWFFVLAALSRFGFEFLRGDPRGNWGGLSTSQWIALGFLLFAVWWFRPAPAGPRPGTRRSAVPRRRIPSPAR